MELDERIVNYMKVRNEYAKMAAHVAASLLFMLASFLCMHALYVGQVFYSKSLDAVEMAIFIIAVILSACICIVNILTCKKARRVYIKYPDSIAIRNSSDVVREAYYIARPVLIQKITLWTVILFTTGLVYIMLMIFLEDPVMAQIYGKIIVCLGAGVFVSSVVPCIDRLYCYRMLLGEVFVRSDFTDEKSIKKRQAVGYVLSVVVPVTVCVWYLIRYYGVKRELAWVAFPFTALFTFAVIFLIEWKPEKAKNVVQE